MSFIISVATLVASNLVSLFLISPVDYNIDLSKNIAASAYLSSESGINIYKAEGEAAPMITTRVLTQSDIKNRKPLDSKLIFELTNKERVAQNLKPLVWNETLAKVAEYKAKDMNTRQYFAHKSPDGVSMNNLADKFNYKYSLVGENLAMGDFINSGDVVLGWMNSPGHRANILKPTYTELGVYSIYGLDGKRKVWFSVQEFGRPSPACAKPDQNIETLIKSSGSKMQLINIALNELRSSIESSINNTRDAKGVIESYNNLINLSNSLYKKTTSVISEYNLAVNKYNNCILKENNIINAK